MSINKLANEASPYLLQHKDNPVHWVAWNDEALKSAKDQNKPILLSVGYAACHWCHVMAHESFEDESIAQLMNNLFINIKVDREERPDLDAIYQNAIAMLGQQGGWPLTVFLTPDGTPFWGGTYFPPTPKWGRPGFPDILQGVSNAFHDQPEDIAKNAGPLKDGLAQLAKPTKGAIASIEQLDKISSYLVSQVDFENGGIGSAPKFPQPMVLKQLWNAALRSKEDIYDRALAVTLRGLCEGGIYDHLAGGFSRYSVDERWLVPHFEKMLYDNAQLISLLTNLWKDNGESLYEKRVTETIDWCLQDLRIEAGGFCSSFDADSEGVEGKFYVWQVDEIDTLLGENSALFKRVYDVTPYGNWEGSNILNQLLYTETLSETELINLENCRKILLEARSKRIPPARDDKILADWNGLMISALIEAGLTFNRADWVSIASNCFDFICQYMTKEDRLSHSWCNDKLGTAGLLEDYANMSAAAISLYEATNDARYLTQAETWFQQLELYYHDELDGAYYTTAKDKLDLITNQKLASDNAVPAGNGTLLGVLTKLHLLSGKEIYNHRAQEIIENFSGELDRNFYPLSTFLNSTEFYLNPTQIVMIGEGNNRDALLNIIHQSPLKDKTIQSFITPKDLPDFHPASDKKAIDGKVTVYICQGPVCSLPTTEEKDLFQRLQ